MWSRAIAGLCALAMLVCVDGTAAATPTRAPEVVVGELGMLQLAILLPDVRVELDGAPFTVASLTTPLLPVPVGPHVLEFAVGNEHTASLRLEVRSGHTHIIHVGLVGGALRPVVHRVVASGEALDAQPQVDLSEVVARADAYMVRRLSWTLPGGRVLAGDRALKVAAAGYLTRELRQARDVSSFAHAREAKTVERRAAELMASVESGRAIELASWHWIAVGAGVALLATGTSVMFADISQRGALASRVGLRQRLSIPGVTGVNLVVRDEFARVTIQGRW